MKKIFAISAICLPLVLSSCGTKTIIVEATTTTTEAPAVSAEDAYFDVVLGSYPDVVNRNGRQWVIEFGNIVCDEIDNGMTLNQLLGMVGADVDGALVGFMVRHAIIELCPRNQWFLDAAANA